MGTDVKGACEDTTGMEEFVSEAEAVYRNRQIFFSKYDKTVKMKAYQRCMGMDFFFFFFANTWYADVFQLVSSLMDLRIKNNVFL